MTYFSPKDGWMLGCYMHYFLDLVESFDPNFLCKTMTSYDWPFLLTVKRLLEIFWLTLCIKGSTSAQKQGTTISLIKKLE